MSIDIKPKLQGLIDGKKRVIAETNAKAYSSLTINNSWSDISRAIKNIKVASAFAKEYCLVKYVDLDGTILKEERVKIGSESTPPDNPNYDPEYLIFNKWTDAVQLNNITRDMTIAAIYNTVDNATYYFFELDSDNLIIEFSINGIPSSIDYGDGSTGTDITHTYSTKGNYVVKIYGNLSSIRRVTKVNGTGNIYLKKVYIGNNVTSIGAHAFSDCYSLTSINIPEGVTSIREYAFNGCYSLTSINIPEGVTSIGAHAFSDCYSLTSINIPKSVTSIREYAFRYCYSLTSINIPEGVTSIGTTAFNGCYSLTSINIPEGVKIGRAHV